MGSLTAGAMSQLSALVGQKNIEVIIYIAAYNYFHIWDMSHSTWLTWLLAAILYDFGYYVTHRIGHEMNFGWAGHQVHHSSEYYNMATALRQSMWHKYYTFPAFIPMAIVGVPPAQMLLHHDLNLLYQFWIHTEQIDKLPSFFEFIFNTPSHHRVHHGRNPY